MKFTRKNLKGRRWVDYAIALCIAVVLYLALSHINYFFTGLAKFGSFISPVVIGFVIAYVVDPLVRLFNDRVFFRIRSKVLRRNISVTISLILIVLFIVILSVALIPQLVDSALTFFKNFDGYVKSLQDMLQELAGRYKNSPIDISGLITSGGNLLDRLTSILPKDPKSILDTSVSIGKNVLSIGISCILAIYFLLDKAHLREGFKRFMRVILPEKAYGRGAHFWKRCNSILIRYIACSLLDALIIGCSNAVFMAITRMPYIALISVVVGVTNLAPTFGPIVGGAIGMFILVLVRPWFALIFLIFTFILQTIDGYVIKPKLFGDQLGVPGVWILISIIVLGRMFGVVGILLAIPAAAIIDFIYRENFLPWAEKRRLEKNMEARQKAQAQETGAEDEE